MDELHARIIATVSVDLMDEADPAARVVEALGNVPYACVIVLAAPEVDLDVLTATLQDKIDAPQILGARTAGEICDEGYSERKIVALGFPRTHFAASARMFEALDDPDEVAIGREVLALRHDAQAQRHDFDNEFAFLLVDGLSRREDAFVLNISTALGTTQLFGGSSGDGLRFERAPVFYNGLVRNNAAIVLVVRSNCRFKTFREDHFEPSEKRLVVTGAIPEMRLVTEINAEPAAPEYARIVGIDPNQLSPFIFASHPIVVSVGDQHHVRAIQRVEENGHLRFFASIDEGMVLTVASARSITNHLQDVLEDLSAEHEPDLIFACDCILRRLEAEQKQEVSNMSAQLKKHRVVGFSTYGEQHNMLHVNQTLTGIAIYPPEHE